MGLISAIKSVLGMDDSREGGSATDVTVERQPDATSERAVKESEAPASEPDVTEEGTAENSTAADAVESADPEEAEPEPEPEDPVEPVEEIKGIGPAYAERLAGAGVHSVADLAEADADELGEATGIGASRIEGWIERANAR